MAAQGAILIAPISEPDCDSASKASGHVCSLRVTAAIGRACAFIHTEANVLLIKLHRVPSPLRLSVSRILTAPAKPAGIHPVWGDRAGGALQRMRSSRTRTSCHLQASSAFQLCWTRYQMHVLVQRADHLALTILLGALTAHTLLLNNSLMPDSHHHACWHLGEHIALVSLSCCRQDAGGPSKFDALRAILCA